MKKMFMSCLVIFFMACFSFAQQIDPTGEKQREKYEKELQQKQNELISEFVGGLEVDEFQQEIIKQKLHSYAQLKMIILNSKGSQLDKKERIDNLDDTHFQGLAGMASNEVMLEIQDFIKSKHQVSKKKKKKKKRKDKGKDDNLDSDQ